MLCVTKRRVGQWQSEAWNSLLASAHLALFGLRMHNSSAPEPGRPAKLECCAPFLEFLRQGIELSISNQLPSHAVVLTGIL